jgi:hypothetical protein
MERGLRGKKKINLMETQTKSKELFNEIFRAERSEHESKI